MHVGTVKQQECCIAIVQEQLVDQSVLWLTGKVPECELGLHMGWEHSLPLDGELPELRAMSRSLSMSEPSFRNPDAQTRFSYSAVAEQYRLGIYAKKGLEAVSIPLREAKSKSQITFSPAFRPGATATGSVGCVTRVVKPPDAQVAVSRPASAQSSVRHTITKPF